VSLPTPLPTLQQASNAYSNATANAMPTPANTPANRVLPTPHTPQRLETPLWALGPAAFRPLKREGQIDLVTPNTTITAACFASACLCEPFASADNGIGRSPGRSPGANPLVTVTAARLAADCADTVQTRVRLSTDNRVIPGVSSARPRDGKSQERVFARGLPHSRILLGRNGARAASEAHGRRGPSLGIGAPINPGGVRGGVENSRRSDNRPASNLSRPLPENLLPFRHSGRGPCGKLGLPNFGAARLEKSGGLTHGT
jgi:hypothetical protein